MMLRHWVVGLLALAFCGSVGLNSRADDWDQWRGANRAGVWSETGVITAFTKADIKPSWRQNIGTGYSSPTVAAGKVFVMDFDEKKQDESIRCFDAKSGKPIWEQTYRSKYSISYTAGPRAAVTIHDGKAYALGAMGRFHCLDATDGKLMWENDLNETYGISKDKRMPIWGIAASPIVVGDLVIVQIGAKDACVVAFDKNTGKEAWKALDDRGQYSSPVLATQNGKEILVCWTGDGVAALDPANGETYWYQEFKPTRMPIGVATPVIQGNKILLTSFYDGAMMLEMTEQEMSVKLLWHEIGPTVRATKAIHSIISTPMMSGDHIYGVDSHGELRCLKSSDGSRVWEDLTAVNKKRWGTIHFVPNGENVWMLNEQGELMIGQLTPEKLTISSRAKILEADQMRQPNRRDGVVWSHPAFADKCIFVRNDSELICIDLAK